MIPTRLDVLSFFKFCTGAGALLMASFVSAATNAPTPISDNGSEMKQALVRFLRDRDSAAFATATVPNVDDWRVLYSSNLKQLEPDPEKALLSTTEHYRRQVEEGAKAFMAKADELHLDFSHGDYSVEFVDRSGRLKGRNLDFVVSRASGTTNLPAGDFRMTMQNVLKVPDRGWRCTGGIGWTSFPAGVLDEQGERDLVLIRKAASNESLTGAEDPALHELGLALMEFARTGDVELYKKKAIMNADLVWAQMQKRGGDMPSRTEFDTMWEAQQKRLVDSARSVASLAKESGIDLRNASIKLADVSVKNLQGRSSGSVEGMRGAEFVVTLSVESDGKSATGTSLSGTYALAASDITRFGDQWKISSELRWQSFPNGVASEKLAKNLELENYVAEHMALPPGMAAPEIEFTRLDNHERMKLSALHGKIVVLDFWATWCGPCQQPMAELQTLRKEYPNWKDRVAIVPISIDDTEDVLLKHLDKRGWTNTFNVWAGDGGWNASAPQAFRVRGVPTTYIIDSEGKILRSGHPASMPIGDLVDGALKKL